MSWKSDFDLGGTTYLNGANHGPLPRVAIDAANEALEWKRDPSSIDDSIYFTLPNRVRRAAAPFFNCDPEDLAVTTGASAGMSLLAGGLEWKPKDHVVIPAGEFPAVYLPWVALRSSGVEVTVLPTDGGLTPGQIVEALRSTTRVVAVGHVNFATGHRLDVEAIGRICRDRGIAFVIDATQSVGSVPFDVRAAGASVVAAAGYKWMLSPYGTGVFYVDPEWVNRLRVPFVNWATVNGAEDFNKMTELAIDFRAGATRWDAPETASFLNCNPMAAALEFLGQIGVEQVFAYTRSLIDRLVDGLPTGFRVESSLADEHRSSICRLVADDQELTRAAYQRCLKAHISVSMRESGLRVSPGVWNSEGDIDRLLQQLNSQ
jgi:selenocysteine lyase/cysteine desulfurase